MRRYAARIDATQHAIVDALRSAGVSVWIIREPVDLLTWYRGVWLPLECKTGKRKRNDQPKQQEFLKLTGVPIVRTPDEALRALGALPWPDPKRDPLPF